MLLRWWGEHKMEIPPMEIILPNTGYICDEAAAGFLYLTNSPVAVIEWVVSNPFTDKKVRNAALEELIDHLCMQAKLSHHSIVMTMTSVNSFAKRLERLEFTANDHKVTHLMRAI